MSPPSSEDWEETDPAFFIARLWTPGPWLTRRRRLAIAAAGLLLGLTLASPLILRGVLLLPPVSRAVSAAARRAVTRRLGGALLSGPVHVGWFGVVELWDLTIPGPAPGDPPILSAQRIRVRPSLSSLLRGQPHAIELELRWVRLHPGPRGSWLPTLLARLASKRRAARVGEAPAEGAAPPEITIRDLFVDLPLEGNGGLTTLGPLAFRASWTRDGPPLAASGLPSPEGRPTIQWRLSGGLLDGRAGRFACGGLLDPKDGVATLHARADGIRLVDLPPGWFSSVRPLAGTLTGELTARRDAGGGIRGHGLLTTHALSLSWARLDPAPVQPIDLLAEGDFRWDSLLHRFVVRQGQLGLNRGVVQLEGDLALFRPQTFHVELKVAGLDLQSTIDSLPKAFQPPQSAPRVEGLFGFDLELRGPLGRRLLRTKERTTGPPEEVGGATSPPGEIEIVKADLDLRGLRRSAKHGAGRTRGGDSVEALLRPLPYRPEAQDGPPRTLEIGPRNPRFASYASLPSYVPRAVVTSEDAGFFGHHGFDFEEIRDSVLRDLDTGQAVRGGSTLTQQLVKNLFLSRTKTLSRKIREALVTLELEAALPKSRILELYLNTIEWGPDLYGIGEAAERYFGVPAPSLSPKQAAFLATIIPNPRRFYQLYYARGAVTPRWNERVDRLLTRMHALGALDDATYAQALAEPLVFHRRGAPGPATSTPPDEGSPSPSLWDRLFRR